MATGGVLIASMDTGEYSSEVTKQDWEHLGKSRHIVLQTF
jgi:hypothetical protein